MNINHFKKKRNMSNFEDEEEYFEDQMQETTEARNVNANASSRVPFSDYRQQKGPPTDMDLPPFSPGKSSTN